MTHKPCCPRNQIVGYLHIVVLTVFMCTMSISRASNQTATLDDGGQIINARQELELKTRNDAIVIIETRTGRASGFAAAIDGVVYVISNAHAVIGDDVVSLLTVDGKIIPWRDQEYSMTEDLVRFKVEWPSNRKYLEFSKESASIGQDVIVCGNSMGAGVVTEISGKVLGIGPKIIEVNAEFVQGNSGSPIIKKGTGDVLGVATFVTRSVIGEDWVSENTRFSLVRRFGTIISGTEWIAVDRKVVAQQVGQIHDMDMYASDCLRLMAWWVLMPVSGKDAALYRHESISFFRDYSAEKEMSRYSDKWWPEQLELFCDMCATSGWDWKWEQGKIKQNKQNFTMKDCEARYSLFLDRYIVHFRSLPVFLEKNIKETKWRLGYLQKEAYDRTPLVELLREVETKVELNCNGVPRSHGGTIGYRTPRVELFKLTYLAEQTLKKHLIEWEKSGNTDVADFARPTMSIKIDR